MANPKPYQGGCSKTKQRQLKDIIQGHAANLILAWSDRVDDPQKVMETRQAQTVKIMEQVAADAIGFYINKQDWSVKDGPRGTEQRESVANQETQ